MARTAAKLTIRQNGYVIYQAMCRRARLRLPILTSLFQLATLEVTVDEKTVANNVTRCLTSLPFRHVA
ncbi:fimbria/pilus outer membrane usher protein [Salmonella enterica subsp. enterica]|nr:fimbria/pilus outer membrane usher protein [Salmonella enterica subsp. enterica]